MDTDPDPTPDPAIFVRDRQDGKKNILFFSKFFDLLGTF